MTSTRGSEGRFTTDPALVVQSWDSWMVRATGIAESAALGVSIATLYPDLAERGLLERLRRVADGSGVEVLSPALHKYFLPCPPLDPTSRLERMRQHVVIAPIRDGDDVAGVTVTIEDVSPRFEHDRQGVADLDSQSEAIRLRAATALADDAEGMALLSGAMADDSWRVRRVAAEGLAASDDAAVVDTLLQAVREHHHNPALLNSALTALGRKRKDIALSVVPLLDSADTDVRTYAALILGLVRDERAIPALVAALGDADANVQYHAIEALGRSGSTEAAEPLTRVAESRDFFLGFAALDALALIGDGSQAQRLIPLLEDPFLAAAAATCLGAIGGDDVVVPLAAAIERAGAPAMAIAGALAAIAERVDSNSRSGAGVGDVVSVIATDATRDALVAVLPTTEGEELRSLVVVLSWLSQGGIDAVLAPLLAREDVRRVVADRLARRGIGAAPFVEAMASDENSDVQRAAAFALGGIGSPSSVPTLLGLLARAPDADLATVVAEALGAAGDARAFAPLLALLDHDDSTVRLAAVAALSSIAHPELEEAARTRLTDASPRVRESAVRLAGYFTWESCLPLMLDRCGDDDAVVRRTAVEAIATYDTSSAWQVVCTAVRTDTDTGVRAAGARALGQASDSECRSVLVEAMRDPNLWVRYYAVRACARRGESDVDTVAALMNSLIRERAAPVRVATIEALSQLRVGNLLEPLTVAANDPDDDVSCAALRAIGAYHGADVDRVLQLALERGGQRQAEAAREALASRRPRG